MFSVCFHPAVVLILPGLASQSLRAQELRGEHPPRSTGFLPPDFPPRHSFTPFLSAELSFFTCMPLWLLTRTVVLVWDDFRGFFAFPASWGPAYPLIRSIPFPVVPQQFGSSSPMCAFLNF